MLAGLQRRERGERVRMLGRADDDRVDVVGPVVELSIIGVRPDLSVLLGRASQVLSIHITQRNGMNVAVPHHRPQITSTSSTDADERQVEPLVRIGAAQNRRRGQRRGTGDGTSCQKLSTGKATGFSHQSSPFRQRRFEVGRSQSLSQSRQGAENPRHAQCSINQKTICPMRRVIFSSRLGAVA